MLSCQDPRAPLPVAEFIRLQVTPAPRGIWGPPAKMDEWQIRQALRLPLGCEVAPPVDG